MKNRRYVPNVKNKGIPPIPTDRRQLYFNAPCGECIECRRKRAKEWQARLMQEIKDWPERQRIFITLTFAPDELRKLTNEFGIKECNAIATIAVRRFRERVRKKTKRSIRHWFVTELGHKNTERIHLHGFIFTELSADEIRKLWKYGNIYIGDYVNEKSCKYITKYITKMDVDHKGYKPIILTSPGIGASWVNSTNSIVNIYQGKHTITYIRDEKLQKMAMPRYWYKKIYTEAQRRNLWSWALDKDKQYLDGQEYDMSKVRERIHYYEDIKRLRYENEKRGYGKGYFGDKEHIPIYNITERMMKSNYHKNINHATSPTYPNMAPPENSCGFPVGDVEYVRMCRNSFKDINIYSVFDEKRKDGKEPEKVPREEKHAPHQRKLWNWII